MRKGQCSTVQDRPFKTSRNDRQGYGRLQEYMHCSECLVHARPRLPGVLEALFGVHTVTGSDAALSHFLATGSFWLSRRPMNQART